MPTGPKGQKRPADAIGNAVKVMRIATGEEPEDYGPDKLALGTAAGVKKEPIGRAGGKRRAELITLERRVEIAKQGAAKRWSVRKQNPNKADEVE